MHPVDLSQRSSNAIAFDRITNAAARRKPNLQGHLVAHVLMRDRSVHEPNAPHGERVYIRAAPVKERTNEPLPLEPKGSRKRVGPF